jgi:hypothetical protein
MAEGIVYLDVDDEITSAAQRIRSASGTKIALVVPYGSRIATSRMNFRLLSREALVSNKRLSIVSGDAGSRSLAASAGLPVFGSVGEYETSIAKPREPGGADGGAIGAVGAIGAAGAGAAGAGAAGAASPLAASETVVAPAETGDPAVPARKSQRPKRPLPDAAPGPGSIPDHDPDETATIETGLPPEAAAAAAAGAAATTGAGAVDPSAFERLAPWRPMHEVVPRGAGDADLARDLDGPRSVGLPPLLSRRLRAPVLAGLGVVGLAAIVVAVGAYLFLPSASIRLTPRREPIGPIQISVAADPEATAVDEANGVVPAVRLDVPVEAANTFTTTGTHVELSPASGSVTFQSYDFQAQNTIDSGSIVATEGGIRFRTLATVTLPKATLIIPPGRIEPSSRSVRVQAVRDGSAGNVPANAIRVVPEGEDPVALTVNNPDPTDGGARTETPEVTKAEVDKAVAAVRSDLQDAFDAAIAGGAGAPAETTLFAETAVLGEVTTDGDPQSFVGTAAKTFDVKMTAQGTVLAVDPRPVDSIAAARLADEVGAGHRLVDGSVDIVVGEGSVGEDGQITFEATARATRVAIVDAGPLRDLVKGRSAADAKAALAPYGEAVVTLWPDWVSAVTSMDSRLEVTIVDGPGGAAPKPSSSGPATRSSVSPAASRGAAASASSAPPSTTP